MSLNVNPKGYKRANKFLGNYTSIGRMVKHAGFDPASPSGILKPPDKPPGPEPVKPMPTYNSEAVKDARRRSLASQRSRKGRSSTVLSQPESLG